MLTVKTDFAARSQEIKTYFEFACDLVDGRRTISPPLPTAEFEEFKKTLKANAFLLLYNLVESTLCNAIEAIFDDLGANAVRFDQCRKELQCVILSNLRRHNVDKIQPVLTDIALHVVTQTFRKKQLFAGNVDARKVRDTAVDFGFAAPPNGHKLVDVKKARNSLAHGEKSFAEVGRDSTTGDLKNMEMNVIAYLSNTIDNIEAYLTSKQYLAASVPSTP